jgi:hypothetical protein
LSPGDVLLIAEYALVGASGMGNEEGDDHNVSQEAVEQQSRSS